MSKSVNVLLMALAMTGAGNRVLADMTADIAASGLSADQVGRIETQSCRAWHAAPITGLRSEPIFGTSTLRVSFECDFHGEYQGNRLATVGMCDGTGTTWDCEASGTLIELSFSARRRSAILFDVPLPEGIDLLRFLERESAKGRGLDERDLPGTVVRVFALTESRYLVRVEYIGLETSIHVDKRCSKRGCKFKLDDVETYPNYNDF